MTTQRASKKAKYIKVGNSLLVSVTKLVNALDIQKDEEFTLIIEKIEREDNE